MDATKWFAGSVTHSSAGCEERLNPETPYLHFSNPASKCHDLLFYGVPNLDDDDDDWWVPPGAFLENDDE
jgi:hypothetical protein